MRMSPPTSTRLSLRDGNDDVTPRTLRLEEPHAAVWSDTVFLEISRTGSTTLSTGLAATSLPASGGCLWRVATKRHSPFMVSTGRPPLFSGGASFLPQAK